jgi:N-formylglutamate deformylase
LLENDTFVLHKPRRGAIALPVLIDLPHCGSIYPDDFKFCVNLQDLRKLESKDLDQHFFGAVDFGATLLCASLAPSYVDCNGDAAQVDQRIFLQPPEKLLALEAHCSVRSVFPCVLSDGRAIYDEPLTFYQGLRRLEKVYFPYHLALKRAVAELSSLHPVISHLTCVATSVSRSADVSFSNGRGDTASSDLILRLVEAARSLGLSTQIMNAERAGHIIQEIGDPLFGIHSVEIEFNPKLQFADHVAAQKHRSGEFTLLAHALIKAAAEFAASCSYKEAMFRVA